MNDLIIDPSLTIPAWELSWTAVRAAGPGGQHVNKVSTKIELRFDLLHSHALSDSEKRRLRDIAGGRVDAEGRILIQCQETRSQSRNLEEARELLAELIRQARVVPKRRKKTRPSRAARERRLRQKRAQSSKKQERRKVGKED